MPPTQRFSKEDILNTAFQLVREQGFENLNARNIAKMLNSSTQPVFSYYENMTELKTDLFAMVNEYHSRYFDKVETDENLFVHIGMAYIDFAIEEPNFFRLLFMSNGFSGTGLNDFFVDYGYDCNDRLFNAISQVVDPNLPESNRMFIDIWLYAHGIASMLVMNTLPTPRSEIKSMLENMYDLLTARQRGDKHDR